MTRSRAGYGYFRCQQCALIFADPEAQLSSEQEKAVLVVALQSAQQKQQDLATLAKTESEKPNNADAAKAAISAEFDASAEVDSITEKLEKQFLQQSYRDKCFFDLQ